MEKADYYIHLNVLMGSAFQLPSMAVIIYVTMLVGICFIHCLCVMFMKSLAKVHSFPFESPRKIHNSAQSEWTKVFNGTVHNRNTALLQGALDVHRYFFL